MGTLARRRLGRDFHWHEPRGKANASFWKTLGTSLVALPASLLVFLALAQTVDLHPMNRLKAGGNEIYYELFATRADAERLAEFLRKEQVFTHDSAWTLTLHEGPNEQVVIAFAVPAAAFRDEGFVRELDGVRKHVLGVLYPESDVRFELRNGLGAVRRIP
jgi:hypothetical protein